MAEWEGRTFEDVDVDGLREYLERSGIVFAILFGSHARGTADASSDVDIALRFPDDMSDRERFRHRNRIDAELQAYASGFVDVSDIETLPNSVAYAALQNGIVLAGDEGAASAYRRRVETEHRATADDRDRERRELIDRLARGDV